MGVCGGVEGFGRYHTTDLRQEPLRTKVFAVAGEPFRWCAHDLGPDGAASRPEGGAPCLSLSARLALRLLS